MSYYEKNINELRKSDSALASKIDLTKVSDQFRVEKSKTDLPTLLINDKYLHSKYDPVKEAKKWAEEVVLNNADQICVCGFGFGYHIKALLNRLDKKIYVVEPSLETLKCALESLDLSKIIPKINWICGKNAPLVVREFSHLNFQLFFHNPSISLLPEYYKSLKTRLEVCGLIKKTKLKIMVVNPIYGGSLPTAIHVKNALINLGHGVEVMESDKFKDGFFQVDKVTSNEENRKKLIALFTQFLGEAAAAKAVETKPDLIIALAQAPLGKEILSRLKSLKIPIAFWFVEDFRTLTYWEDIAQYYDYIFTIQKGEFFEKLKSKGIKNYYYLPQACAPERHRRISLSKDEKKLFGGDLSFMGAGYYNRKAFFEKLIDYNFKIWGTQWDISSAVGRLVQKNGARVEEDESIKIYNAAKINLNLHSSSFHEGINPVGDFVNPRTFEIAACEGFQLVDYRSELPELFEIGKEIICFKDINELKGFINYYLDNEEERERISQAGSQRAKQHHSFENRMREMLSVIFEDKIENLQSRGNENNEINNLIDEAGAETELGRYLAKYKDRENFSLKDIVEDIEKGKGSLTKEESIFLIMNQFIKEKGEKF